MPPSGGGTMGDSELDERVGFAYLKEENRRLLFQILDGCEGSKAMVWDPVLMKLFNMVSTASELRIKGVENIFSLDQKGPVPSVNVQHVIYLIQPTLQKTELVGESLRTVRPEDKREFHLVCVPRAPLICEEKLREMGVISTVKRMLELPIFFYDLDSDIASMESETVLRSCLLRDNWSALYDVVLGLDGLENVFGRIPNVYFKGDWAQQVYKLLLKKREQDVLRGEGGVGVGGGREGGGNIHSLLLIDRWIDPITPLVTQLTYEGLIDEIFGITCGAAKFPKDRFSSQSEQESSEGQKSATLKTVLLNSKDELYDELRNLNFNAVGPALRSRIKSISEKLEERHSKSTVREYREFVKRLPELQAARQSAGIQTTIAELIKEVTTSESFLEAVQCEQEILNSVDTDKVVPYIEDAIAKGEPLKKVLRLLCLQSLTTDGLKPKVLDQYRKEILQSYGYEQLSVLLSLQKTGLLMRERGGGGIPKSLSFAYPAMFRPGESASFPALRKAFRLINDEISEKTPSDPSYVYSGYAPLTVRLCQYLVKPGWRSIMETLKRVPGATGMEEGNNNPIGHSSSTHSLSPINQDGKSTSKKLILVLFIGGVTYAEAAALRFLSSRDENYSFLVATTHMLTGDKLLNTMGAV